MCLRAFYGFAWLDNSKHRVRRAWPEIKEETCSVLRLVCRTGNVHRPIATPSERGDKPLARSAIPREEGRMTPTGFPSRSRDGFCSICDRSELPGAFVAPFLVLGGGYFEGRLFAGRD